MQIIQLFYLSFRNEEVILSEYLSFHVFFFYSFHLHLEPRTKVLQIAFPLSLSTFGVFLDVIVPQET